MVRGLSGGSIIERAWCWWGLGDDKTLVFFYLLFLKISILMNDNYVFLHIKQGVQKIILSKVKISYNFFRKFLGF